MFIDFLSWSLSFPALAVCTEGKCLGNVDVTVPGTQQSDFAFVAGITAIDLTSATFARASGNAAIHPHVMIGF